MDILYLSHCVPNPPDKGERIRAFHFVRELARRYRVHVVALARSDAEAAGAAALREWCASVHVERMNSAWSLARAALRVAAGDSLAMSFYRSESLSLRVRELCNQIQPRAAVAFSTPMAQYVPAGVPLYLDMADVDSEKWFQYARLRTPGPLYSLEGRRLRTQETLYASRAACTYLATAAEAALLKTFTPAQCTVGVIENGVEFDYFDPAATAPLAELQKQRTLVFVGVLDYYPNSDGICWFARQVLPGLRRSGLTDALYVVGRNPTRAVRGLASLPGVTVTGGVPDVRPYLASAQAVVAPLRLARGIQNKVLEGLAMGNTVLASPEVARTFGGRLPTGVVECADAAAYGVELAKAAREPLPRAAVRRAAVKRFVWSGQLNRLVDDIAQGVPSCATP